MIRRAKGTKGRSTKTTVLVVTNGEVTELRYLEWLRDKVNGPHEKYSVTVKDIPGDPSRVLSKVPTKNYDQGWLVVDRDDHSSKKMQSFIKDCQRENIDAVVSVPCFEVWLNAHYARVKNYQDQKEAQRHYRQLSGVSEKDEKTIPQNFPYDNYEQACANAHLAGKYENPRPNVLAKSPATPMPFLLSALGLIEESKAQG
ncbi:RloB family protein [Rothia aeria]|uniref:RloB family protein n=1 Tax=Rothia aeria TaxID=172042 RepID=UPI0028D23C95|nr:RloB family protein [Rothia aeria]